MRLFSVFALMTISAAVALGDTHQLSVFQAVMSLAASGCPNGGGINGGEFGPAPTSSFSATYTNSSCFSDLPGTETSSAAFHNGVFYSSASVLGSYYAQTTMRWTDSLALIGAPGQSVSLLVTLAYYGTQSGLGGASVSDASSNLGFILTDGNFPTFQSGIFTSSAGQTLTLGESFDMSCSGFFSDCFNSANWYLNVQDLTPGTSFVSASGIDYATTPEPSYLLFLPLLAAGVWFGHRRISRNAPAI